MPNYTLTVDPKEDKKPLFFEQNKLPTKLLVRPILKNEDMKSIIYFKTSDNLPEISYIKDVNIIFDNSCYVILPQSMKINCIDIRNKATDNNSISIRIDIFLENKYTAKNNKIIAKFDNYNICFNDQPHSDIVYLSLGDKMEYKKHVPLKMEKLYADNFPVIIKKPSISSSLSTEYENTTSKEDGDYHLDTAINLL